MCSATEDQTDALAIGQIEQQANILLHSRTLLSLLIARLHYSEAAVVAVCGSRVFVSVRRLGAEISRRFRDQFNYERIA
jgi:hypothetical protein